MTDILRKYYEIITRTSGTLYSLFNGEKKTHSELVCQADSFLPIILRNPDAKNLPDYYEILNCVVDMYEVDVGIKTFAPYTIAKDKKSKYWLYKVKPTIPHCFFERYKLYLSKDGFPMNVIKHDIEPSCEEILSYCANPKVLGDKKRGLVVGDVQSGKTANYLGLINMAFDYGYKIVILLAGTTDSLRLQTQKRTDKGVIGARSDSIGNSVEYIGVGFSPKEHFAVPFTNQSNDFAKFIQKNLNAAIGDFNKPVVLVVKKVKSILESVSNRLQSELDEKGLDSKCILIIDDEADNASINTAKTGNPATTINKNIRDIFNKFPTASYVGYTATPFANIFINPHDDDSNLDLFPSDFIVQLNAPDTYFGGRKVFSKDIDAFPRCLRLLNEEEPLFLPVVHDKYTQYSGLAESLKEAIHSFLINNVVRTLRNQPMKHRSMMINITRFNDVQAQILDHVNDYIERLTNELEQLHQEPLEKFIKNSDMSAIHILFTTNDFYTQIREGNPDLGYAPVTWEEIQSGLYDEIKKITIVLINSKNGKMSKKENDGKNKRFDYEDYEDTGARVIAIGGMVLSRGLTLEGLMTSYYSRNAGTYDTLLQMCRWFGYRPRYEDLCRIYMSQDNIDRFDAALSAVEDMKEQFAEMERQDKKPRDFGLMIKEVPDTLETTMLITARNKMKATDVIEYHLNYGGVYADTSKLAKDPAINKHNCKAFRNFYSQVSFGWNEHERYMATNVSKLLVADFVRSIKVPYINRKFDVEGLSNYIENSEVFPLWDVVIAKGNSKTLGFLGINKFQTVIRSFHIKGASDPFIRIGGTNNRVMEPGILNAGLWLTDTQKQSMLEEKNLLAKDGKQYNELGANDYLKRRKCPILVIYPIDLSDDLTTSEDRTLTEAEKENIKREKAAIKESLGNEEPLLAFAIGFPKKESGVTVIYRANQIKLDEMNANLEIDDEDEGTEDDDD